MATSTHYTSLSDPNNAIIVSKENDWSSVKVYAKGSIQYQANNAAELRRGKTIKVDGLGSLQLYLGSELEVRVDGVRYEASKSESNEKVRNVSVIFWLLTGFTAAGLLFIFMAGEMLPDELFQILVGMQIFALAVYATTAILLRRKLYWFYFVGAGTYTFFSLLQLIDIEIVLLNFFSIMVFVIRIVFLFLVLRILPVILQHMRESKAEGNDDVILDQ